MAKDHFHETVKLALEKDGWTVTEDFFELKVGKTRYSVDLAAEKLLVAERETEKILVEVKSFLAPSLAHEYHAVVGQYRNYRLMIELKQLDRELFLAVPADIYDEFFTEPFGQASIKAESLKLIVFNPNDSSITQWIK